MFGTAGGTGGSGSGGNGRTFGGSSGGASGSKYNASQGSSQFPGNNNQAPTSVAAVTAVKMTYNGPGTKLYLTLEDHGVMTTCGIPTFDPEMPVVHEFNEEVISTVSMKSKWLDEGLRDLDSTSPSVILRLSPETPNFRISSLGNVEALDINYSLGDVLDSYDSNLLVMVIDTNPFEWEHPSAPLKLNEALQHILAFMNAHLAGRHDNKLAVIASHVGVSKFLYPTPNEMIPGGKVPTKKDANAYQNFKVVNDAVLEGIKRLLADPKPTLEEKDLGSSKIAASLSLGLCYINQTLKLDALGHIKPRMLVLTVSPDSSSDYIPIMNCIFSAQKANIPIDVCKIWGEDAVFLQQAAHITEGIYMRPNDPRGLLQVLMFSYLPDMFARSYLYLPGQDQVDFRAACFCHKKIVDIGFVCSVCLSIFCSFSPVCSTCRTKFAFQPLLNPARRLGVKSGASNPGSPRPSTPTTPSQ
ncbi:RNA polymerase II transcription factor B subunit 4 [Linnemannia gamsii]|uniref:General transcription and DNA repair factor IIH subunit TFB4 n=1 Tax=Linnemannia gamsii TaxID=64522 RepID=A0ABQ7JUN7_9FUNG|nr:RNA polymerase II transcription factor B subunit 4 [Linnemannia gamsii]